MIFPPYPITHHKLFLWFFQYSQYPRDIPHFSPPSHAVLLLQTLLVEVEARKASGRGFRGRWIQENHGKTMGKPWENHGKMLTSPRNMETFHDFSTFGMALEDFNEFSCLLLSFNVPPFLYVTFQRLRRAFTKVFHGLLLNHGGKPVIRSRRRPCDLQPSDVMWISCFF